MVKHHKILFLLLFVLFFLTGCWDRMEIEERATILGLSIDIAEEENEDPINHPDDIEMPKSNIGMIEVTAQLAVPGQIPLGPSQGGGSGGPEDTVWIVKTVGHNISDAINNLQQQLAATLFLGHLQVIIISEEVAKEGIGHINDFMKRHPEIRRDAWMLINGKEASETLKVAPRLERIPAIYLASMLDGAIKMGKLPKVCVGRFWINIYNDGQEGYLPFITVKAKDNIQVSGIAYFQGDKLMGMTKPYQIFYFNGLIGHNPGGGTTIIKLSDEETTMFQTSKLKSKYKVMLKNGQPYFQVYVEVDGKLLGKNYTTTVIDNHAAIERVERKAEEQFKLEFKKLIKETQEKQSDILGFGEYVRADLPKY